MIGEDIKERLRICTILMGSYHKVVTTDLGMHDWDQEGIMQLLSNLNLF